MTLAEKSQLAADAADQKRMTARIWVKDDTEIRVYLRRTNAARDEAGYIRLWTDGPKALAKYYPPDGSGKGSRTAQAEGEAAYARYLELRKTAQKA